MKITSESDYRGWLAKRWILVVVLPLAVVLVIGTIGILLGANPNNQTASQVMGFIEIVAIIATLVLAWPRKRIRKQLKSQLNEYLAAIDEVAKQKMEEQSAAKKTEEAKLAKMAHKEELAEARNEEAIAEDNVNTRLKFIEGLKSSKEFVEIPSTGLVLRNGEIVLGSWPSILYGAKKGKTKGVRVSSSESHRESSSSSSRSTSRTTVSARRGGYGGATLRVSPRVSINRGSFGSGGVSQSSGYSTGSRSSSSDGSSHSESVNTPSREYVYVGTVDEGVLTLTNRGFLFVGQLKQIEMEFSEIAQFFWDEDETIVTVVKRKSTSPFNFDIDSDDVLSAGFEFDAAINHSLGRIDEFVTKIKNIDTEGRSLDFQVPEAISNSRQNFSESAVSEGKTGGSPGAKYSILVDSVSDSEKLTHELSQRYEIPETELKELLKDLPAVLATGVDLITARAVVNALGEIGTESHFVVEN